jgi:hypothetical protein
MKVVSQLLKTRELPSFAVAQTALGPMPPPKPLPPVYGQLALPFGFEDAATRVHDQTDRRLRRVRVSTIR